MSFCTAINCLDGRVQLPVIRYMQERFEVEYVDMITDTGPAALVDGGDDVELAALRRKVDVSCRAHGSSVLAVVAHHDCAGNPLPDHEHQKQLARAGEYLTRTYPDLLVTTLWVDCMGRVVELALERLDPS